MHNVTPDDLLKIIGNKEVEITVLRMELARLQAELRRLQPVPPTKETAP